MPCFWPPIPVFLLFAHASHVAGILCGNGKHPGIAPQAHILPIKILDANGQGTSAQAIAALRWIMDNARKYTIKVVNLSIGTNDKKVNQPLMEAAERLWRKGITVIAAAGNAERQKGFSPPPPISQKIITVGAWEDREIYQNSVTTSPFLPAANPLPDLWAPGENIISVLAPGYRFGLQNRSRANIVEEGYILMSGTSMATPMVSGAAALLLEKNPKLSPDDIKKILIRTAMAQDGLLDVARCIAAV